MGTVLTSETQRRLDRTAEPEPFAPLATSVLQLLQSAHIAVDRDIKAAKAVIATAATLIQKEIVDQADTDSSGLAGWQQRRLRAFIDERFTEAIPTATLASLANLSVSHFTRAFKKTFGVTPHAFVLSRRLEHSLDLMLNSDKSLAEVSYEAGFADQAHFCRAFRRRFRSSPAAWRREQNANAHGDLVCRAAGSAVHVMSRV